MTIKVLKPTIGDRILAFLGKKRGVIVPTDVYEKHGLYAYAKAKRESFWKALFRSKSKPFPENVFDLDTLREKIKSSERNNHQREKLT